ncbi:hypothetical protein MKW98_028155 [Papaver atlanticum]|uniref:Uncharacterized protein n=1 Tax=Papaver atlanticum TaxID=357466 RepID=A0AAD4XK92_9MAGN|nr:hypothetical protein MKW98_028155 [Papaver atlanticum]
MSLEIILQLTLQRLMGHHRENQIRVYQFEQSEDHLQGLIGCLIWTQIKFDTDSCVTSWFDNSQKEVSSSFDIGDKEAKRKLEVTDGVGRMLTSRILILRNLEQSKEEIINTVDFCTRNVY